MTILYEHRYDYDDQTRCASCEHFTWGSISPYEELPRGTVLWHPGGEEVTYRGCANGGFSEYLKCVSYDSYSARAIAELEGELASERSRLAAWREHNGR